VVERRRLSHARAHVTLASVVVVWAGAFAAIKHLLSAGLTGPEIAAARFLLAAPGFAVAFWWSRGLPGAGRAELIRIAVAGVLVVAVYHVALNQGERYTTAGTAAIVIGTAPAIALGLAIAIGLERFSAWRAAGLAVAFGGVVVAVTLGSGEQVSAQAVRGPLLVLVSACSFALYNVLVKPMMQRFGPVPVSSAANLIGLLPLLPLLSASSIGHARALGTLDWALVLYLGLVCTLFAYIAWTVALRHLDASRTVAYLYGVPPLAVLIGALTLSEPVTVWLVLGGMLVIGGVAAAQVRA
jgi:drug/metabolite transporter (DMT)-like permease